MFCPFCGKKIDKRMEQCPNCHKNLPEAIKARLPEVPEPELILDSSESATVASPMIKPEEPVNQKYKDESIAYQEKKGMSGFLKILLIVIPVLFIGCILIVAGLFYFQPDWLPFDLPSIALFGERSSSDIMVMVYEDRSEYDYSIIRGEETIEIYDDMQTSYFNNFIVFVEDGSFASFLYSNASYIPNSDYLYVWELDDDKQVFQLYNVKTEETKEIFDSKTGTTVYIVDDGTIIFIDSEDDNNRVYVSVNQEPADRVLKAESVEYLPGLNQFFTTEFDEDQVKAELYDLDGNLIAEIFEGEEPVDYDFSDNGHLLTATFLDDGNEVIRVYDLVSLTEKEELDGYKSIVRQDSSLKTDLIYVIAEDEEGMLYLEAYWEGEWQTLVEEAFVISANPAGKTGDLAYLVCEFENEDCTAYITDLSSGETIEVFDTSDSLKFYYSSLSISDRFLMVEIADDKYTLYSFDFNSGDYLELFNDNDIRNLNLEAVDKTVFISVNYENGDFVKYVCSPYQEGGYVLAEDWAQLLILDANEDFSRVLIMGREDEDDDLGLYIAKLEENAEIELIDDDDIFQIRNAAFVPGGKTAAYFVMAAEDGSEMELRIASLGEDINAEVMEDDVTLISFAWEYMDNLLRRRLSEISLKTANLLPKLDVDEVYEIEMTENEQEKVFRFFADPEKVYFLMVESEEGAEIDPSFTIMTTYGIVINEIDAYDDNSEGFFFSSEGQNELEITVVNNIQDHEGVKFNIWVNELPTTPIRFGEWISEEISDDEYIIEFEGRKWYANAFSFEAQENDLVYVEFEGPAEMPRYVYIMSPDMIFQEGVYIDEKTDLDFTCSIEETGTYFVFVVDYEYEDYDNHTFELFIDYLENVVEEPAAEEVVEEEAVEEEVAEEEIEEEEVVEELPESVITAVALVTDATNGFDGYEPAEKTWEGMQMSAEEYNLTVDYFESEADELLYENLQTMAEMGYDMIFVTASYETRDMIPAVAALYPDVIFVGVDMSFEEELPNLISILYDYWNVGFLAGAVASNLTQTGTVSVITGPEEFSYFQMFAEGFVDGASFYNTEVELLVVHTEGELGELMQNTDLIVEHTETAINESNADVFFTVSGIAGLGTFEVASAYGDRWCIGNAWDNRETLPEDYACYAAYVGQRTDLTVFNLIEKAVYDRNAVMGLGTANGWLDMEYFEENNEAVMGEDFLDFMEEVEVLINEEYLLYEDFHE